MLVFVLLVSIGMSWFAVKLERARRQREAVEAIRAASGSALYDYELPGSLTEPPIPKWMVVLLGEDFFCEVVAVVTWSSDFGDDAASHLKALTTLRFLALGDTQITDAGLEHLEGMTSLKWLDLKGAQVTPEGVKKLQLALPECDIEY